MTDSSSEVHCTPDDAEVHTNEEVGVNAGVGNEVRGTKVGTDDASDNASLGTHVTKHCPQLSMSY
jgi:hypothetical protein